MTFRGKDGRFSGGVNLRAHDLRSWLHRLPGDHWLAPADRPVGAAKGPWRIPASRFPELVSFPLPARPTVKVILWTIANGRAPEKLRRTCSTPGCLNPSHQEELHVTQDELYHIFFTKAYEACSTGDTFSLPMPNEGQAISHRAKLNKFRKKGLDEHTLPEAWRELILRIREENGQWRLIADMDTGDFEDALRAAMGGDLPEPTPLPSALDLLNED